MAYLRHVVTADDPNFDSRYVVTVTVSDNGAVSGAQLDTAVEALAASLDGITDVTVESVIRYDENGTVL